MLTIYPTETVSLTIKLYYAPEEVDAVEVDFEQDGVIKLTRTVTDIEDGDDGGGKFTITLDPDETALFEANHLAHYQVRVDLGGIYDILPPVGIGVLEYYKNSKKAKCANRWSGGGGTTPTLLQEKTVTPAATSQVVTADDGYTGLSKVTVEGDTDLAAANIRYGASIFGKTGTFSKVTGSAAATANDLMLGKKAFVNGAQIFGTYVPAGASEIGKTGTTLIGYGTDITFTTNVTPDWFVAYPASVSKLNPTEDIVTSVVYDGTDTYGITMRLVTEVSGTRVILGDNPYFTHSFAGNTLTVATTSGAVFEGGNYEIVYGFTPR